MKNITEKEIKEKESKIYNYVIGVLNTVSSYYGYRDLKLPVLDGETIRTSLEDDVLKYYQENIKSGLKKYSYSGCVYQNKKETNVAGFLNIDIDSLYQDAEMISMVYRMLEELRIENLIVKIESAKDYDLTKLQEYLEYLDVDYEITDSGNLLDDNTSMSFEIIEQIEDKEILLASGSKNNNKVNNIASTCYLDNIIEILSVIFDDYNFDVLTQVTIIGETEEEKIAGMRLAQDLRWCEIVVDFDTTNSKKEEQLKNAQGNFIIVMDKEILNKGLIKVIDSVTKEETLVDEAEIIDYIVSNI